MANYQYTSDLVTDVLNRVGEPLVNSTYAVRALQYLNRAYGTLCRGGQEFAPELQEDWLWLRKYPPGTVTLLPEITTGTVAVTAQSAAITFSSAPAASVANYHLHITNEFDVYRIATHTAGQTAATLDSLFTGSTNTVAGYSLRKLEYALASDVLRLISPMRMERASLWASPGGLIQGMDAGSLLVRYPLVTWLAAPPDAYAQMSETVVRFSSIGAVTPQATMRIEYDYLAAPAVLTNAANEEPVIPLTWRHILADIAVYYLWLDKNDARTDAAGLAAKLGLQAMARENRHRLAAVGDTFGHIAPRQARTPWQGGMLPGIYVTP